MVPTATLPRHRWRRTFIWQNKCALRIINYTWLVMPRRLPLRHIIMSLAWEPPNYNDHTTYIINIYMWGSLTKPVTCWQNKKWYFLHIWKRWWLSFKVQKQLWCCCKNWQSYEGLCAEGVWKQKRRKCHLFQLVNMQLSVEFFSNCIKTCF